MSFAVSFVLSPYFLKYLQGVQLPGLHAQVVGHVHDVGTVQVDQLEAGGPRQVGEGVDSARTSKQSVSMIYKVTEKACRLKYYIGIKF